MRFLCLTTKENSQFQDSWPPSSPNSLVIEQTSLGNEIDEPNTTGDESENPDYTMPAPPKNSHGNLGKAMRPEHGKDTTFRLYTDDKRPASGMCRFPRACVNTNGTLLLPNSFERFRSIIARECNLKPSRVSFYDLETAVSMRDAATTRHHHGKHLVGLETLRFHIPHMVTDLLKYTLVLLPYLQLPEKLRKEKMALSNYSANTTIFCHEPDASQADSRVYTCDSDPPPLSSVLVEKRARSMGWVPGIFRLLQAPTSAAPLEAVYTDEAFPREEPGNNMRTKQTVLKNACFASISVAGKAHATITPQTFHESLLTQPAIVREIETVPVHAVCRINVTIINRPLVRQINPRLGPESRRVVNIEALRDALLAEAHRLNISIELSERSDFHKISFQDQFKVMQETQSLISVHGAELGNLIFMRKRSAVVEIFPFRYWTNLFEGFGKLAGLGYDAVTAEPDVEGYRKCMLDSYPQEAHSRKKAELAVRQFEGAADAFFQAKASGNSSSVGEHFDGEATAVSASSRICSRSQRLVLSDPKLVAQQALKNFTHLCYGTSIFP